MSPARPSGAPFAYGVVLGSPDRFRSPAGGGPTPGPTFGPIPGGTRAHRQARTGTAGPPRLTRVVDGLSLSNRLSALDDEAREQRLDRIRRLGLGVGTAALAGVLVYGVFPVRTYLDQREAIDRSREQLDVLTPENERKERQVRDLHDPETIEQIARRDYGYVMPDEESYAVLPPPAPGADGP